MRSFLYITLLLTMVLSGLSMPMSAMACCSATTVSAGVSMPGMDMQPNAPEMPHAGMYARCEHRTCLNAVDRTPAQATGTVEQSFEVSFGHLAHTAGTLVAADLNVSVTQFRPARAAFVGAPPPLRV